MKKNYFIICLLLTALSGINSAIAAIVIITAQTNPTEIFIPSLNNIYFPGIEQNPASQYITILSPPPQV